jgi:fructokinase
MNEFYGGIEAGGTKFVCAVGNDPDNLRALTQFPTTSPDETIERAVYFFREQQRKVPIAALGIGTFGPADLNPRSASYGYITTTPKTGWKNTDLKGRLEEQLGIPTAFDTDVNAAALGEYHWGAARNLNTFIYLTIGTGIGGGSMLDGRMLHGLTHPEMGHIRVPHDWDRDPFPGTCPYHGDCLEGLAAGPSIEKRYGQRGENLPENHPAWTLLADYLALALSNFICTISPQRIILGGGVMEQEQLIRTTRQRVQELLNGYIYASEILEHIDSYIVRPKLGNKAGVLGAIALAFSAGNLPPDINLASSGPNTIS